MVEPRKCYALISGVGLAILANSRPYEGLLLSEPIGVMFYAILEVVGGSTVQ
jgi:hypothetical protein